MEKNFKNKLDRILDEWTSENWTKLMKTMENTIMKLIGLLLINNQIIINITERKINGKRIRGRPRKSFYEEIFH